MTGPQPGSARGSDGDGGITTHVLDTALGRPAAGVPVALERATATGVAGGEPPGAWEPIGEAATDGDGRCGALLPAGTPLTEGTWRLTFDTSAYFDALGTTGFYPRVTIAFEVRDAGQHYHVPLLLSPYGYATYRGS
jgi:5-hydroxyisourate hydrolase